MVLIKIAAEHFCPDQRCGEIGVNVTFDRAGVAKSLTLAEPPKIFVPAGTTKPIIQSHSIMRFSRSSLCRIDGSIANTPLAAI
jgi:hypothetical protein